MTKMMTTKEVAERLNTTITKAKNIIRQPDFPKVTVGARTFIIPEDTFEEWVANKHEEKWAPLRYGDIDLTHRYEVSNTGKIRTVGERRILKQHKNKQGYMSICISFGKKKRKVLKMHRAVAYAFLDNPHKYPVVNHLDGNKTNNNVTNLEWCTAQDNVKHAIRMGLFCPGTYHNKKRTT